VQGYDTAYHIKGFTIIKSGRHNQKIKHLIFIVENKNLIFIFFNFPLPEKIFVNAGL